MHPFSVSNKPPCRRGQLTCQSARILCTGQRAQANDFGRNSEILTPDGGADKGHFVINSASGPAFFLLMDPMPSSNDRLARVRFRLDVCERGVMGYKRIARAVTLTSRTHPWSMGGRDSADGIHPGVCPGIALNSTASKGWFGLKAPFDIVMLEGLPGALGSRVLWDRGGCR